MGVTTSLPTPDGARPALWTGAVWGEKEFLDVIRKGFKKRDVARGPKRSDHLSGWREIGGGGPSKSGQYLKKGLEEGKPKVSSGSKETNLEEWRSEIG